MEHGVYKRPTGWLGELYDQVASYNATPVSEIERIAQRALNDNAINRTAYTVLQHRVPFSGYERETLEEVGIRLGGKSKERSRYLEYLIYQKLQTYLPEGTRSFIEELYIEEHMTKPTSQMLTVGQTSKLLGVHKHTIRRWSDSGILISYRIGPRGDRKFKKQYIENYLDNVRHSKSKK